MPQPRAALGPETAWAWAEDRPAAPDHADDVAVQRDRAGSREEATATGGRRCSG